MSGIDRPARIEPARKADRERRERAGPEEFALNGTPIVPMVVWSWGESRQGLRPDR
jgi:hypothetical protein